METFKSNLTPPPTDNPPLIEKPSKKKRAPSPNLVHPKQSSTDQIGGTGHMSTGLTKAYHHAPSRHLPGAAQTQPSPKIDVTTLRRANTTIQSLNVRLAPRPDLRSQNILIPLDKSRTHPLHPHRKISILTKIPTFRSRPQLP
ncbi:hypothetical protein H4Q26_018053 [Puccinia striiformis f. sp. tritici PST-130]|nr:hypothetical protein H4Q26_018053 [Puccinia striiformis f. sp. tritici PST-130]